MKTRPPPQARNLSESSPSFPEFRRIALEGPGGIVGVEDDEIGFFHCPHRRASHWPGSPSTALAMLSRRSIVRAPPADNHGSRACYDLHPYRTHKERCVAVSPAGPRARTRAGTRMRSTSARLRRGGAPSSAIGAGSRGRLDRLRRRTAYWRRAAGARTRSSRELSKYGWLRSQVSFSWPPLRVGGIRQGPRRPVPRHRRAGGIRGLETQADAGGRAGADNIAGQQSHELADRN